jgi:hypothetical protein
MNQRRQRPKVVRAINTRHVVRANGRLGTPDCPVHQWPRMTNCRLCPIWKEITHRTATGAVRWCTGLSGAPLKRSNPLKLKCDTITSHRRLVNTFIHQIVPDLLKRDKPIKVVINFKSWSTTRDISSEWG